MLYAKCCNDLRRKQIKNGPLRLLPSGLFTYIDCFMCKWWHLSLEIVRKTTKRPDFDVLHAIKRPKMVSFKNQTTNAIDFSKTGGFSFSQNLKRHEIVFKSKKSEKSGKILLKRCIS